MTTKDERTEIELLKRETLHMNEKIDKNHKQVMDSFTKLEKSMEAQVKTFATKEEYTQNKNSLSRLWKIVWTVITFVFMAIAWVAGWAMMEFIKNS